MAEARNKLVQVGPSNRTSQTFEEEQGLIKTSILGSALRQCGLNIDEANELELEKKIRNRNDLIWDDVSAKIEWLKTEKEVLADLMNNFFPTLPAEETGHTPDSAEKENKKVLEKLIKAKDEKIESEEIEFATGFHFYLLLCSKSLRTFIQTCFKIYQVHLLCQQRLNCWSNCKY